MINILNVKRSLRKVNEGTASCYDIAIAIKQVPVPKLSGIKFHEGVATEISKLLYKAGSPVSLYNNPEMYPIKNNNFELNLVKSKKEDAKKALEELNKIVNSYNILLKNSYMDPFGYLLKFEDAIKRKEAKYIIKANDSKFLVLDKNYKILGTDERLKSLDIGIESVDTNIVTVLGDKTRIDEFGSLEEVLNTL